MADSDSFFTDEEIDKLNIVGLKNYLRRHNQFVTGKKSELVERAKGVRTLGVKDSNQQEWEDHAENESRQKEKQETPLGERLPDPSSLGSWSDDWMRVPDFSEGNMYNYFVLKMKTKMPEKRGGSYMNDHHIHSVQYHDIDKNNSHCYVKCQCIPSLPSSNKKQDPDHSVWLCLSKVSGQVHFAYCKCTAGEVESCNHVGALMYCLVELTEKRRDGTLSSTSQKCKWNNPRKRKLSPKKSQDLQFKKNKVYSDSAESIPVSSGEKKEPVVNVERFRSKLEALHSKAGWLTFFESKGTEDSSRNLPCHLDVSFCFRDSVDLKSEEAINMTEKQMKGEFSVDEVKLLEEKTRGQAKNELWISERKTRITSSNFSDVVNMKVNSDPNSVIKRMLYSPQFESKYTRWGRKHEPAAIMKYKLYMKRSYSDIKVNNCGLFVLEDCPYLGASPDGIVTYTENGKAMNGLLEVKCPASEKWKFKTPQECCEDSSFYCELIDGKCCLKQTHKYYLQVLGQMGVTHTQWCDFFVWTLKGFSCERIYFNQTVWEECLGKLKQFYVESVLPELFSRRVERGVY